MPFAYYRRLSTAQKRVYDASCRLTSVPLPEPDAAAQRARELESALATGDVMAVQRAAARLVNRICDSLGVQRPSVEVLSKRPRSRTSELHGLYTHEEGERPVLQVWMRTAAHRQVVAFRTFLRTLLHETLHHLDYAYFKLPDSMHTEGFYARESSLARQLVGASRPRPRREAPAPTPSAATTAAAARPPRTARAAPRPIAAKPAPHPRAKPARAEQLSLFELPASAPKRRPG